MSYVRTAIGILLSVVLLWFLFRDTDWSALYAVLGRVEPGWLVLALTLSFSSSVAKVQRWSYVVRATHPATFRSMFSATQIGLLVNILVPARMGDVIRGFLLARLAKVSFARCLTLVALDRINDIFALVSVLLVTLVSFPSNTDIQFAAGAFNNDEPFVVSSSLIRPATVSLILVLFSVILVFVLLYFQQSYVIRFLDRAAGVVSKTLADKLHAIFSNFAAGMHIFRSIIDLTKSVFFSLLTWGLVVLSLAALLRAFQLEFPWYAPFLMLSILGVFTSVTITPGMVGQYHVPIVASLLMTVPSIDPNEAKAVAIVAHVVAIIPPVALGVYSMVREGLRVGDLVPKLRTRTTPPN